MNWLAIIVITVTCGGNSELVKLPPTKDKAACEESAHAYMRQRGAIAAEDAAWACLKIDEAAQ
jgi:hypothetical protein